MPRPGIGLPVGMRARRRFCGPDPDADSPELLTAKRAYLEAKRHWLDEAIKRLDERIESVRNGQAPADRIPEDEGQQPE